jgi:hypothetical protein
MFCQIVLKLEFSQHIFEKYSNIKFHKNLPSEIAFVACRLKDRGETDRRTDRMTMLIVTFCNYANAPKYH